MSLPLLLGAGVRNTQPLPLLMSQAGRRLSVRETCVQVLASSHRRSAVPLCWGVGSPGDTGTVRTSCGDRAVGVQGMGHTRKESRKLVSGSGVYVGGSRRDWQHRPSATRSGDPGVQFGNVRPAESNTRSEGELFGSEVNDDQGHPAQRDSSTVAVGPSPG